jgi:hypothetical protein
MARFRHFRRPSHFPRLLWLFKAGSGPGLYPGKWKGGRVKASDLFLAIALLALLGLAIAVTSGVLGGPSDLEMRKRASEPLNLEP